MESDLHHVRRNRPRLGERGALQHWYIAVCHSCGKPILDPRIATVEGAVDWLCAGCAGEDGGGGGD